MLPIGIIVASCSDEVGVSSVVTLGWYRCLPSVPGGLVYPQLLGVVGVAIAAIAGTAPPFFLFQDGCRRFIF